MRWVRDFITALSKVQSNGYTAEDLVDGPDIFNKHIKCEEKRRHRPSDGKLVRNTICERTGTWGETVAPTPYPPATPPPTPKPCDFWCAGHKEAWDNKCAWPTCG